MRKTPLQLSAMGAMNVTLEAQKAKEDVLKRFVDLQADARETVSNEPTSGKKHGRYEHNYGRRCAGLR
jgi:hypothetical protein